MLRNLQVQGIFTLNGDNEILDINHNNKQKKISTSKFVFSP